MTDKVSVQVSKAFKAQLVVEIAKRMKAKKLSQSELARRMGTSRAVVHRLLKTADVSLTLTTLASVATALGSKVTVKLS